MPFRSSAFLFLALMPTLAWAISGATLEPVQQAYRDFAWEAVVDSPTVGQPLLAQSDAVWARYFSPRLIRQLRADRRCVAKTHGPCRLDFSPLWASQDPSATRLVIQPGTAPATVEVSFDVPGSGQRTRIIFHVVRRPEGWRIDDVTYPDGQQLRQLLAAPR